MTYVVENGNTYPDKTWFIMSGTVTVESNGIVVVNAKNAYGKTIKAYFNIGSEFVLFGVSVSVDDNSKGMGYVTIDKNGIFLQGQIITLTATPNYGYHFTQWSDGNKDNPRIVEITQDTSFTAEFAIDRSGTCGDNYALRWTYDVEAKTLTISGSSTLNSNYTFGLEAPSAMERLVIAEGVTSIGSSAFAGYATLREVIIPASVTTVYEQAFYNCTGLKHIFNYRARPCVAYSNTFDGIDKFDCTLHVLSASVDMYKAATGWRDFYYIATVDAEQITEPVVDVVVTPTETMVDIVWPSVPLADTYELTIKDADGNVILTLVFNAQGQLTGIVFSAPSRNGQEQEQPAGFSFTVTGLNSNSSYSYDIVAKDSGNGIIDTKHGTFKTKGTATGIEETDGESGKNGYSGTDGSAVKVMRDGVTNIVMLDGRMYDLQGKEVR